ncbi:hypothetical protein ABT093_23935 [Kitasatospora sp. NPDC002551]
MLRAARCACAARDNLLRSGDSMRDNVLAVGVRVRDNVAAGWPVRESGAV